MMNKALSHHKHQADKALERASPLPRARYKLDMVTELVLKALESAAKNEDGGRLQLID